MKSLRLNKIRTNELTKRQMSSVTGGTSPTCTCGCCYENDGGSNTSDNMAANYDGGLYTKCDTSIPIYH